MDLAFPDLHHEDWTSAVRRCSRYCSRMQQHDGKQLHGDGLPREGSHLAMERCPARVPRLVQVPLARRGAWRGL
eukprot:15154613-Heterocapsa_arctica.AAC.1